MKMKYGKITVYLCHYSADNTTVYAIVSRSKKLTQRFKVNIDQLEKI